MLSVIVNPVAGGGHSLEVARQAASLLTRRGISHEIFCTERSAHATLLARQAVESGADGVVALGGDGTLFEVVNGIGTSGVTMYFVPCGTGNDLARVLPFDRDPIKALEEQLDGAPASIDLCQVNDVFYLNISGAGFDAEVLRQTENFKHLGRGLKPYLMGVCAALRHFRPLPCELILDGQSSSRSLTIISVANGRYLGGGMCAAPFADISDGLLEVVVVRQLTRARIALLMPFFIPGWHVRLPVVETHKCREVILRCKGMTVNIDGELRSMDEAHYRILPGGLHIRRPNR